MQTFPADKLLQQKEWYEPVTVNVKLQLSQQGRNRYPTLFDSEIFYIKNKFVGDGALF